MASITIVKCLALPAVKAPNTIYIVKGEAADDAVVYITGANSNEVRHTISRSDVEMLIEENGTGILTVDYLPLPTPELAGRLFCLAGNGNTPCWCTGTEWIDLAKLTGAKGDVSIVNDKLLKELRNAAYFNIKLI